MSALSEKMKRKMMRISSKARMFVLSNDLNTEMDERSTIVAVRMRPPNKKEKQLDARTVFASTTAPSIESTKVIKVGKRSFTFDAVIGSKTSQADVYKVTAKQILNKVLAGFNGTVMAYGQTGSGKTYTMQGVHDSPGIIPRICASIFLSVKEDKNVDFDITCSYVEIYNENLHDLLTKEKTTPIIVEHATKGITLKNVVTTSVNSQVDVADLFERGAGQRAVGFTEMNAESSRSHAVFTIYVKSQQKDDLEGLTKKVSKFHLIDLAGSERADRTGASGTRLKEGAMINQSLSALGNVINALTKGTKDHDSARDRLKSTDQTNDSPKKHTKSSSSNKHVPYRSSKLTRLLQDSLGGNSYTMLICNVSPAKSSIAETLSSLRFAERAKQVQNKAKVNADPKAVARLRLMEENNRLLEMVHGLRKQMNDAGVKPVEIIHTKSSTNNKRMLHRASSHNVLTHSNSIEPSLENTSQTRISPPQVSHLSRTFSSPSFSDGPSAHVASYDEAIKDANAQIKFLEDKSSTLQEGRTRVRKMREEVRIHQEALLKEHESLEKALHELTKLESKVANHNKERGFNSATKNNNDMEISSSSLEINLHLDEISSQLNQDGKIPYIVLEEHTRRKMADSARRDSIGILGQIDRQNQEDRAKDALKEVSRDDEDYVLYSEFVSLLAKYAQEDSDLIGSSQRSPNYETRSRSANQYKRSIDNVVGHHQTIVSTQTSMSKKNMKNFVNQLEHVEKLLKTIGNVTTPDRPPEVEHDIHFDLGDVADTNKKNHFNINNDTSNDESIKEMKTHQSTRIINVKATDVQNNIESNKQQQHSASTNTFEQTADDMNRLHSLIRWNKKPNEIHSILSGANAINLINRHDSRNGNTSLHIASQNGHIELVTELIARGANVNAKNSKGNTALHVSV
jgi:hypothetical protein